MTAILVGDVGGTNLRLALCDEAGQTLAQARYPSEGRDPLAVLDDFLAGLRPDAICLAAAGPIRDGRVRLTNVGQSLDEKVIALHLGAPCRLINDFHAQAASIALLGAKDRVKLCGGEPRPGAPIAILGAGTGLGEALLVPTGDDLVILATEGGHARFAPRDARDSRLLAFLRARHGDHVSYERVLSGPGLVAIYDFLRGEEPAHAEMADADSAALITEHAVGGGCAICGEAVDLFSGVYADEAANLALKCLAAGGVYLAGGIAPRLLDLLGDGRFARDFCAKGRFGDWLGQVPVWVVTHRDPGLLGAFAEGLRLLV